jgi:hypothetical protein
MEQNDPGFCLSCGMPLEESDLRGEAEKFCTHCTDEDGNVRSREEVRQGLANWIMQWQHVEYETALKRAEHYMKAMPAWADDK